MAPSINEKENEKVVGGSDMTSTPEDVIVNTESGDAATPAEEGEIEGSWSDYKVSLIKALDRNSTNTVQRILTYAGPTEYLMQGIALIAAIGSGAGIALQNLIFGQFITIITDFTSGESEPSKFRKDVADLA
jgi:ATP-binding cassette subfamily B (MDR/TAP) protein 1